MSDMFAERGHWLWGSAREIARNPHTFPAEIGRRGDGIGQFRVLHQNILAVSRGDHARQVLITHHDRYPRAKRYLDSIRSILGRGLLSTEGPDWLAHRRQMLPAFRRDRLSGLAAATRDATLSLVQDWETGRHDGQTIPLSAAMQELTLKVMASSMLSTQLDGAEAARFGGAVKDALAVMRARNNARIRLPLWVPLDANRQLSRTKAVLDRFVLDHIEARRKTGPATGDMLDSLIASRFPDTSEPFNTAELRDETKTLFVAGFETTATTLTWTFYMLMRHPEVAAAWHDELDTVLNGRAPDWSDLDQLQLTRAILNETLRLYPPVYNLPRVCAQEDQIAGRTIRPGLIVLVSIFGIHRSPDHWPNPERWLPERFLPGATHDPQAFLPFGSGKHVCIGADFALAEMTITLALLGQRYDFALTDDVPVGMMPRITLVPDREIGMRITPRAGA